GNHNSDNDDSNNDDSGKLNTAKDNKSNDDSDTLSVAPGAGISLITALSGKGNDVLSVAMKAAETTLDAAPVVGTGSNLAHGLMGPKSVVSAVAEVATSLVSTQGTTINQGVPGAESGRPASGQARATLPGTAQGEIPPPVMLSSGGQAAAETMVP